MRAECGERSFPLRFHCIRPHAKAHRGFTQRSKRKGEEGFTRKPVFLYTELIAIEK